MYVLGRGEEKEHVRPILGGCLAPGAGFCCLLWPAACSYVRRVAAGFLSSQPDPAMIVLPCHTTHDTRLSDERAMRDEGAASS